MPGCRRCRACGESICGWRRRDGRWEPLGLAGISHACPPKTRRNWWARERRRLWRVERGIGGVYGPPLGLGAQEVTP